MKIKTPIFHSNLTNEPLHRMFDEVETISVQGYDEQRRVIYWNKGSESLYGFSEEEALGQKLEQLIIPKSIWEDIITAHSNWVHNNIPIPASEITLLNKKGEDINVFSNHVMLINQDNNKQMYCLDIDLSDIRYAQAQATFKEQMLEAVFEASPDLFFLMTEEGRIIDYRANNTKNLYIPPSQFTGKLMVDLLPEQAANKFQRHFDKVLQQTGEACFEYELDMPSGMAYFEARLSHLPEHNQILSIIRDITEQHKSSQIIRRHAYFDALTLLPNRFLALDRLSQMLNDAERNEECAAVFFIDLDDFKKVNDSLGHEIGDKLLIAAANRLNQSIRKEDTVGRLGGDEFIILIRDISSDKDASVIADTLLNIFREPLSIDGRELILTLSIGIAMYPQNGTNTSELLRNSDIAMYQAKTLGRNAYSFFTKEMNVSMMRRFEVEEQIRGALERNEFEIHYQPLLDVKKKQIIGAEALLRWHNAALGYIPPDEFIPIAEHTGLIVAIGRYVIQQSLRFLTHWQNVSQKEYIMAVNLSPSQFRDKGLFEFIKNTLTDENLPAHSLELEITEGVLMTGQSYVDDTLLQFDQLGVKLSMDDFGTGYSSLSYLRQYAFDVLKIDRSFINGITLNNEDKSLVQAAIAMAHGLGLVVVAEGVEVHQQLLLLEELGCDFVQGFYFSKPIPAEQFITLSKNYKLDQS